MNKKAVLKLLAWFLGIMAGGSGPVAAQYGVIEIDYLLSGKVQDAITQAPLSGIEVTITSGMHCRQSTISDSLGRFSVNFFNLGSVDKIIIEASDPPGRQKIPVYLPADTLLIIKAEDFTSDRTGHWTIEREYKNLILVSMHPQSNESDKNTDSANIKQPARQHNEVDSSAVASAREPGEESISEGMEMPAQNPEFEVMVFPNPSQGLFTVKFKAPLPSVYMLLVSDMSGKTLIELSQTFGKDEDASFVADLSCHATGTYLLSILQKGKLLITGVRLVKR